MRMNRETRIGDWGSRAFGTARSARADSSQREEFHLCSATVSSGSRGKLESPAVDSYNRGERAFTMIEIAFSLAIVAFALVAIMGVLPTGMTVQKDNREDTIINQDGAFWLESMRSGSHGIDDLTNYVEQIMISNRVGVAFWNNTFDVNTQIKSGEQVVGLLSTPKYMTNGPVSEWLTNVVTARVRAINGPASEKGNPTNEFAFRYELRPEITPALPEPPDIANDITLSVNREDANGKLTAYGPLHDANVAANLSNLRVTLRWPLFQQGTNWGVGRNRRNFRGLTNGRLHQTTNSVVAGQTNYFIEQNVYAYVPSTTTTTP
jgi:type II secretory pathway pseudopilin PulG